MIKSSKNGDKILKNKYCPGGGKSVPLHPEKSTVHYLDENYHIITPFGSCAGGERRDSGQPSQCPTG